MTAIPLSEQQLKSICDVLADTNQGLTRSEISRNLQFCRIPLASEFSESSGNTSTNKITMNKRDWLYNCFVNEINRMNTFSSVYCFIESSLNPIQYTALEKRKKYEWLQEEIRKVLLLVGLDFGKDGKITSTQRASTLDDVDRRVNSLNRKLYDRAIHSEVTKYCVKDYLRRDYYDAVFEACKGLSERVKQITGLTDDGSTLFQTAFSTKAPYLFFNKMETDSELSEFRGLRELLEAIFHMIRNPAAHTPKINWKADEAVCLDILTIISFAHKYLDECHPMARNA